MNESTAYLSNCKECDKGIRILLLNNPDQACVLNDEGEMIESAMDDSHVPQILEWQALIDAVNTDIYGLK